MANQQKYWIDGLPYAGTSDVRALKYWRDGLPESDTSFDGITVPSIASTLTIGAPSVYRTDIQVPAITSTLALGTPRLAGSIAVPSIASTLTIGAPTITKIDIAAPSIASTLALGAPSIAGRISVPSIASTLAFGTTVLTGRITVPSIASTLAFGTAKLTGKVVIGDGIASTASLGMPTLGASGVQLFIMGRDRTSMYVTQSMRIEIPMSGPASASFRLFETGAYKPLLGAEVVFHFDGVRKFGGFIEAADEKVIPTRDEYFINCQAMDYYKILNSRRATYDYTSYTSLRSLLEHLIATFLDGEGVGLAPMLDETLDPAQNLIFRDDAVSQALERISEQTGRDIWIDMDRMIHAEHRVLVDSGFRVDRYADNWFDIGVKRNGRQTRTVQGVTLPAGTVATRREEHDATGNWLAFRADYAISDDVRPRVWRNAVAQTVIFQEEMGVTAGLVMITPGSRDVNMVIGATGQTNPNIADDWIIEYVATVETDVLWSESASHVTARASRGNTSGRIEGVSDTGGMITPDAASSTAAAFLRRYRDYIEVQFSTDSATANQIAVGKSVEVDTSQPFLKGTFVVTKYSMQDQFAFMRYGVYASGPEPFAITNATNATPIIISTEIPHGLIDGMTASIYGVEGNTNANVENWIIRVTGTQSFSLPGKTGNAAYTTGGYVIFNAVPHQRTIASVTGNALPVVVTTEDPHDLALSTIAAYTGLNYRSFPIGSVDSLSGNTNANGTGYTLIPLTETTVALGPIAPGPGQDISTWTANGATLTVNTVDPHQLSTGNAMLTLGTGTDADSKINTVTVTGASTFTVPSATSASGTGGTATRPTGQAATASGDGVTVTITAASHGLSTGQRVTIVQAVGFAAIIGQSFIVTSTGAGTFTLDNSPYSGTSSNVWYFPWPQGNGAGTGGVLTVGYGHSPMDVASISTTDVTLSAPHGVRIDAVNLPEYMQVQVNGPTVDTINTKTSLVLSTTALRMVDSLAAMASATGLEMRSFNASSEVPERVGFVALDGPRQLSNVFRKLAGYKIRTVERATFVLAAAVPGFAAAALQTGNDLTNSYTLVNNGVFRQVVVYFKSPPLGSGIHLDIKKNGVSILTSPIIFPDAQALPLRYNNFTSLNLQAIKNDRLTVDVVAVGSTFAGCDGTIHVLLGSL